VLTAEAWQDKLLPIQLDVLRPMLNAMNERELRAQVGNAFLVRSLSPDEGGDDARQVTLGSFDPKRIVRSTRSQQWVHLVGRTPRNAFDKFIAIGRTRNNDVVINHPTVSRFHAFIVDGGGGHHQLYDAGSRLGSLVDGVTAPQYEGGEPRPLSSCSVVRVGSVELTFFDAAGLLANLQ
jgi:hypothetical protein